MGKQVAACQIVYIPGRIHLELNGISFQKTKQSWRTYRRLMRNETIKEFSPNTRKCLLHFPGSERMLRTQLPSIFPRIEPSKTRREIVKNHLLNTRKRRKDEDTVSSLVESPTQLSNAVNDIQRLPSETVRSVSSLVESSKSNTEDEIQGSLIELGKN